MKKLGGALALVVDCGGYLQRVQVDGALTGA